MTEQKENGTVDNTTGINDRDGDRHYQNQQWKATVEKGKDDGLFRACMATMKSLHGEALNIRMGLVTSGVFTDATMYSEAITIFYAATKALETRLLDERLRDSMIAQGETKQVQILDQLRAFGKDRYFFADDYEQDLQAMYGTNWEKLVAEMLQPDAKPCANAFITHIQSMTKATDLAGALLSLWGALIIGGGAAIRARAKKLFPREGDKVLHLFVKITGPGREQRKKDFIALFDQLAAPGTAEFEEVVQATHECMTLSNKMLAEMKIRQWWMKYVAMVPVVALAVGVSVYYGRSSGAGSGPTASAR